VAVLVLVRVGLSAFSAAAAFLVLAADWVEGFGVLGAEPWVATSAVMSSVMPWGRLTGYEPQAFGSPGRIVAVGSENSEKNVSKMSKGGGCGRRPTG
jgi:hypothetical protein